MLNDPTAERARLLRRGRRLEVFTVLWNSIEGIVSVGLGIPAGSIALVGFGIDSFVETSSGLVLLWRLQGGRNPAADERVERRALKLVGISLLALAVYVGAHAIRSLWARAAPDASLPGIVLAVLSLMVMPILARAKRQVGIELGSRALQADSFQTSICMYLSAILLGGLALNAAFGYWWADPLAALVMVPIIVREGLEALRGEHCDDCAPTIPHAPE
jgi:divalent metal cation (Fe/Co/Zn/Cd) transporter